MGSGPKQLVLDALKEHVIDLSHLDTEEPFLVCDLGHVSHQHKQWKNLLPSVTPFFAVKCQPDPVFIRCLAQDGTGFDCASRAEMQLVLDQGISPRRIIFANACKRLGCLRYAKKMGVTQTTFDNSDELFKIHDEHPDAELFLRITADDPTAKCRLSEKFGASMVEATKLLDLAVQLRLNVVGVSFHVGSGATEPQAFERALQDARSIFDHATALGFQMHSLDIGGGFSKTLFASMAPPLNQYLETYFGDRNTRIIAEPGRYFAEGAYTLATNVVARRKINEDSNGLSAMLYLDDGVYGSFANVIYEHEHPEPRILRSSLVFFPNEQTFSGQKNWHYSIWGPTCDSADCVNKDCAIPASIAVNDWLYWENMGAYSTACLTGFNGFSNKRDIIYVRTADESANAWHDPFFTPPASPDLDVAIDLVWSEYRRASSASSIMSEMGFSR